MKKRILAVLLSVLFIMPSNAFASTDGSDSGIFNVTDFGEFKIVYTKRVGTGRGPNSYWYRNCAVIDRDGNFLTEPVYSQILPPSEGRAAFKLDDKWGYFDESWNVVIEALYEEAQVFSEGLAAVGEKGGRYRLYGYIDKDGNKVIETKFSVAEPFENGIATVAIEEMGYYYHMFDKYGKIDNNGNLVEDYKYRYDGHFDTETFDVFLSENMVEINGRRYDNSELQYPFINYLGYTYIPLTYNGCRMLGINCDWSRETGLVLGGGGEAAEDIVGKNNMRKGVYDKASLYKGKLTINGTLYEFGDTYYPLLHYKNVVYMPILWKTGMDALGIEYSYIHAEKIENSDNGCMVFKTK